MRKKKILALLTALFAAVTFSFTGCNQGNTGDPNTGNPPVLELDADNHRVFYQIFVGSFSDSDGDGTGDLRGIINRMDYLNDGNPTSATSLGVTGIWLSPIFKSRTYHKYDADDYYTIDSKFGTEDDLKELVELCHKRNVKLIMDLAINHTSTANDWFVQFKNAHLNGDTTNPYYDYYTCVTDETKINGRSYVKLGYTSGEYYEANFDTGMPELNYDSTVVREAMVDVAKHYLDLGVDGFRFDAIKYIYYGDTPANVDFWEWYMSELKEIKPDIYTVGECWSADPEVLNYYSALNCFNFTSWRETGVIAETAKNLNSGANSFTNYVDSHLKKIKEKNPDAMYIPFISNHDWDRAAGFLPVSFGQMQMAANLYILCSGSPFIYYGEEIGIKGTRGSAGTDANRRLAMLWGDGDTVKDPEGATYDPAKQTNGTVAQQLEDKNSILNYYRKLIAIRNKYPEIARGEYSALSCVDPVGGFKITYNDKVMALLHNPSTSEVEITLPAGVENLKNLCETIGSYAEINGDTLVIGPQTSVILK